VEQPAEYRFRIDAFTPDTIPMWRLAEYMQDLAALLGEREHVHFARLEAGSTVLVQKIDPESALKVQARVQAIKPVDEEGPEDALRAYRAIDRRLAEDNAVGYLCGQDGAEIIRFPGRDKLQPLSFGAFRQPGSLDGVLIRLGGKDETVPVHLQEEGVVHKCNATREMARRLSPHLFGPTLRVHGSGRWERDAEGAWLLKRFDIDSFEILDDEPLGRVVERLRQVSGSGWKDLDDPYAELQRLRQGSGEVH
jgi:hypothetical protein